MNDCGELLCELIAIPSVNPASPAIAAGRAGEAEVGRFLAGEARKAGLEVEFQEVFPGRCNVIARLSPSGSARQTILLAPHLDTVNGSDDQFTPRFANGRIYGRGACDTKGSIAAMFSAVRRVAAGGRRPAETEIVLAGTVDEEDAQGGSRALVASGIKAHLAIVGEPTRDKVVTAHKGSLWLRIITKGRSAHGSRPERGRNAILHMARVVSWLESDYAAWLRKRRHPLLRFGTSSVGIIGGGTQANIVPDECRIVVDRRTLPGETEDGVIRELGQLFRKEGMNPAVESMKLKPCPPMEADPRIPLVATLMSHARQKAGRGADYFCDAAILAGGGIPSVVFGPGDIAQAHTADEWVSTASLANVTTILENFLRSLP